MFYFCVIPVIVIPFGTNLTAIESVFLIKYYNIFSKIRLNIVCFKEKFISSLRNYVCLTITISK